MHCDVIVLINEINKNNKEEEEEIFYTKEAMNKIKSNEFAESVKETKKINTENRLSAILSMKYFLNYLVRYNILSKNTEFLAGNQLFGIITKNSRKPNIFSSEEDSPYQKLVEIMFSLKSFVSIKDNTIKIHNSLFSSMLYDILAIFKSQSLKELKEFYSRQQEEIYEDEDTQTFLNDTSKKLTDNSLFVNFSFAPFTEGVVVFQVKEMDFFRSITELVENNIKTPLNTNVTFSINSSTHYISIKSDISLECFIEQSKNNIKEILKVCPALRKKVIIPINTFNKYIRINIEKTDEKISDNLKSYYQDMKKQESKKIDEQFIALQRAGEELSKAFPDIEFVGMGGCKKFPLRKEKNLREEEANNKTEEYKNIQEKEEKLEK